MVLTSAVPILLRRQHESTRAFNDKDIAVVKPPTPNTSAFLYDVLVVLRLEAVIPVENSKAKSKNFLESCAISSQKPTPIFVRLIKVDSQYAICFFCAVMVMFFCSIQGQSLSG